MNKKIKILVGILAALILVAGGWSIWRNLKCGLGYHNLFCNKSCKVDNDCKFTCGCGAINKNEICHDEGTVYDCVAQEVKCEKGKCVEGEEIISEGVTITTDKVDYEQGETIRITVRNNLDREIWYSEGCRIDFGVLYRLEDDYWKDVLFSFPLEWKGNETCELILCERVEPVEIKPNSEISQEWRLEKICEWPLGFVQGGPKPEPKMIETGTYKVSFVYGLDKEYLDLLDTETIYSKEFTIK